MDTKVRIKYISTKRCLSQCLSQLFKNDFECGHFSGNSLCHFETQSGIIRSCPENVNISEFSKEMA